MGPAARAGLTGGRPGGEARWRTTDRRRAGGGGPRPRHTRRQVIDAAVAIGDAEGLDAVTIRAVAARLGAGAMSLYSYVPDKQALVYDMVEQVSEELAAAGRAERRLARRPARAGPPAAGAAAPPPVADRGAVAPPAARARPPWPTWSSRWPCWSRPGWTPGPCWSRWPCSTGSSSTWCGPSWPTGKRLKPTRFWSPRRGSDCGCCSNRAGTPGSPPRWPAARRGWTWPSTSTAWSTGSWTG